jgi:ABC-type Fe3+/spermidine/putrescine transport system ATPase subunit
VDHDLQLKSVGKVFDNGTVAVANFDLDVKKGEFIAFLGPSGCGKTTTLRMVAGFETATSGDILIRGKRVNDMPPERRPTSMIFQNYALFPHMTVRGNVGYGLDVKGMPTAERDAKVDRILDKLGLMDIADIRPSSLSGGQRQRIALARGLVVEPDVLLLDEPLGALDANLRKVIQAELKLLQRSLGITFVFVTHAQSEALALSDRIVVMNLGRVEQISSPIELYTRPKTPFVAQFIGRNTIFEGRIGAALDTIDTEYGAFVGTPQAGLAKGQPAKIAIPTEALDVFPRARADLAALYGGNVVPGLCERRETIGPIVQFGIRLKGDRQVFVEGHVEKFADADLPAGAEIQLAWKADRATLVPAQ